MIEFLDGNYVSRLFMLGCEGMDVMGCLGRAAGSETFTILFRCRSHVDEEVWDSNDSKHWHQKEGILSEEAGIRHLKLLIENFRMAASVLDKGEVMVDVVVVESEDAEVAMTKMSERPWCHVKGIPLLKVVRDD